MATFTTHGVMGAGFRAASCKLLGLDDWALTMATIGALEGMAPDVVDWISSKLFKTQRWSIYARMHQRGSLVWLGLIFWGFGLHVIFDIPFHKNPGENWWFRLWWLEVLGLLAGGAMLWWAFA